MAKKDKNKNKDAAPEEEGGKKKSKKKLIIILLLLLMILGGAGAAGWFFFLRGGDEELEEGAAQEEVKKDEDAEPVPAIGPTIAIETFIVNIVDRDDNRYLKASLTIEFDTPEAQLEATERMPQLRDTILLLVGSKTFDELRDLQGKLQLRAELMGRINELMTGGKATNVFFTDFVIQ